MSQQFTNIAETVKELLFENWTLKGRNDRLKFFWAAYKLDRTVLRNKKRLIEVTTISGVSDPRTLGLTKMMPLLKIDIWIKIQEKDAKNHDARVQLENDRVLVKNEIWELIHKNQTAITGLDIGTFGNFADPDELEETGNKWLHSIINIVGQIQHRKG